MGIRDYYFRWSHYKQELKQSSKMRYLVVDTVETILVALVLALVIRHYVIQVSLVPTGSMIPTLNVRDRLFVNKFVYRFKAPVRGDIVVFRSPHGDGKDYVKRCIGEPGDEIEIKRGYVYVNGKQLLLEGVNIHRDYSYYGPVIVPYDSYFMLGDNRGNSQDSRYWGFVPKKDLLGKALFTFWPFSRMYLLR